MGTSRRSFIRTSALAGGAIGLGLVPASADALGRGEQPVGRGRAPRESAPRSLRMLILGGTGFTGPHQVRYAAARGHRVTVFNRGRTNPGILRELGVEELTGDRSGDLKSLEGKQWDVVIDNPTTLPRWVRDVGAVLRNGTGQYIFISTISVYADSSVPGRDETTALQVLRNPESEDARADYGALKAAAEAEAEKQFPGRTTIIRPGLIVGPGDPTDRFTYWPVRVDAGGEVLAPGDPADPVQVIDGRDLAEWTIRMAEQGATGIYNATGPGAELSIAEMLYGMRAVTSTDVKFTWVDADFLAQHQVRPWQDMPVWVPPRGGSAGFSRVSIARAREKGLTFRPLAVTVRDTLDWHATRPEAARARLATSPTAPGLRPEREAEVLAAWKARPRS
ncbi:MAG TPA: NAD-dependent epimerase/dehydratase family protein [Gemmatimonadaceae bacterium]|nr:NAD-dependent epimerase/dehydratase family protein [Gemmatimonadaceae bacterium]